VSDEVRDNRRVPFVRGEPLLYRFGFFCGAAGELPSGDRWEELRLAWRHTQVGELVILSHPEAPLELISGSAVLIGHAFAAEGNRSVVELLEAAVSVGFDSALHKALDLLSGRFALITTQWGGRVYHDAVGSRTVFYRLDEPLCVASHAGLIADLLGVALDPLAEAIRREPEYRSRSVAYLPGDLSVYDGVRALVPNNYYEISSGRTVRYWPRAAREKTTIEQFSSCVDAYFSSFASYLRDNRLTPVLGVTPGIDSRAIIAAFRHYRVPMKYVTWKGYALPKREWPVVERMAAYLGRHRYLPEKAQENGETFHRIIALTEKNVGYSGERPDVPANMYQAFGGWRELVFIRGHGGGLVRGEPYNLIKTPMAEMSVAEFVRIYNSSIRLKPPAPPSERYNKLASEAVEQFMARANYEGLKEFGYDPNDLYPWESRLGMWSGSLQNEMDAAMLAMTGFNSRHLFESAFGLELGERRAESTLLDLVRRYDEGLAEFPINPGKSLKSGKVCRNVDTPPSGKQLRKELRAQRKLNRTLRRRLKEQRAELGKAKREYRESLLKRERFKRLYLEIEQSRWWRYTRLLRRVVGAMHSRVVRRLGTGKGA
jgi:hypothetical protein